jgi:hypothetical protein
VAPNHKQHIWLPIEVRKICYTLTELYVTPVWLNYSVGGLNIMKHLRAGTEKHKILGTCNLGRYKRPNERFTT